MSEESVSEEKIEDHPMVDAVFAAKQAYKRAFSVDPLNWEDRETICKLAVTIYINGNTRKFTGNPKKDDGQDMFIGATPKQLTLMAQLKIPIPNKLSKKDASILISQKLGR